jgi:hypothetical protein
MPFCSCSLLLPVPSTAIPIKWLSFHHSRSLLTAVLNSCSPHQHSSPALSTFLDSAHPHQPLWFFPCSEFYWFLLAFIFLILHHMFGGSSRKVTGLSKAMTTHGFKCSIWMSGVLTAGKQGRQREETDVKQRLHIQGEYLLTNYLYIHLISCRNDQWGLRHCWEHVCWE